MNLNKFMLGIGGVMALSLTSCHEDPEYTPAAAEVTPPAYFNLSDDTVVDLEDTSSDFVVHIYRADASGELTVPVSASVTAESGVNTDVFDVPSTVTFADGVTMADIKVGFELDDIVPLKNYFFDFKVDGESTPYFTTDVTYDVSYVPWENVVDEQTGSDVSQLQQIGLLSSGREWTIDCLVQKHPAQDGFYRVLHPYYNAPELHESETSGVISGQRYPEDDPNYLYINANNPRSVYISNSRGKAQVFYYTGWLLDARVPNYGEELMLFCQFSAYLTKSFTFPGVDGVFLAGEDYASKAGVFDDGNINFRNNMYLTYPSLAEPAEGSFRLGSFDKWNLRLANAGETKEWESLGACEFTDPFIDNFFEIEGPTTYSVTVWQNVDNPSRYYIQAPYQAEGGYPYPSGSFTKQYNLEFNVNDPDMVLIDLQDLGYEDEGVMLQGCNAGSWYYRGYGEEGVRPTSWIKSQGLNDTFKDGVLYINHPITIKGEEGSFLWKDAKFTPGMLILPNATAASKVYKPQPMRPKVNSKRVVMNVDLSPVLKPALKISQR